MRRSTKVGIVEKANAAGYIVEIDGVQSPHEFADVDEALRFAEQLVSSAKGTRRSRNRTKSRSGEP